MVQKTIFTETIIYSRSSLGILLILHLMVRANLYFQDIRPTQTLIFNPNSLFHFLHHSQQSLHHVYFLQFSLISVRPLHFDISLGNLQIALVTDVPRVIIITLVLFGQSKATYSDYDDVKYMSQRSFVFTKFVNFSANSKGLAKR